MPKSNISIITEKYKCIKYGMPIEVFDHCKLAMYLLYILRN